MVRAQEEEEATKRQAAQDIPLILELLYTQAHLVS